MEVFLLLLLLLSSAFYALLFPVVDARSTREDRNEIGRRARDRGR